MRGCRGYIRKKRGAATVLLLHDSILPAASWGMFEKRQHHWLHGLTPTRYLTWRGAPYCPSMTVS